MSSNNFLFLFFFFFFSSSSALSRSLPPTKTTLDVASSLLETNQILSSKPKPKPKPNNPFIETKSTSNDLLLLSLTLHSRNSLTKTINSSSSSLNYKTLTLDRLKRDQNRVTAIQNRINLAINHIKKSDLKPVQNEILPLSLSTTTTSTSTSTSTSSDLEQGPILSGSNQGSGEYFSRLNIGTPPKPLYLVLDTGSDVTWVQCNPCIDCYQQSDPIFDPSASSSSYSPISCSSPTCHSLDMSACRNDTCLYQVSYGDGSYTVGDFSTDSFSFGDSAPLNNIAFGCGHDNEGLFVGAAGLLGLGGGDLSFPSQIKAKSFSYCLVDRDSPNSSTLEFGSGLPPSSVTAPLLRNRKIDTFYYISMSGISVGGAMLSIPPSAFAMDVSGTGGIIVDSGTAVTRLQTDAYNSMREAFVAGTRDLTRTGAVALFDTCYNLAGRRSVEVPTVSFHFPEGMELKLPAKNYLIPVDSEGTFCFAFAPTSSPLSIIGNVQQQGTRVTFDLENAVVGFTDNQC